MSRDGRSVLSSMINTDDPNYTVLIRPMNGAVPVQIGSGRAQAISPDGKWALSILPSEPRRASCSAAADRRGESKQIDAPTTSRRPSRSSSRARSPDEVHLGDLREKEDEHGGCDSRSCDDAKPAWMPP